MDIKDIRAKYQQAKTEREKYTSVWQTACDLVGIKIDPNYFDNSQNTENKQLDYLVDDQTAALTVDQFGKYLAGLLWGTGDKVFSLVPSRHVLQRVSREAVQDWYDFATNELLFQINHRDSGYSAALQSYCYEQGAIGTSGIGAFENQAFKNGMAENCIIFRPYGVDNVAIDEGANSRVNTVFVKYCWRTQQIINEFCFTAGVVDDKKLAGLPKQIRDAYTKNDLNHTFDIVFGVIPRQDFDPKKKLTKFATKYRGVWFMEDGGDIFHEEDYFEMPISMCRSSKLRNEIYGRSASTIFLSTARSLNYITGETIRIIEKISNPALGILGNALMGDSVLDTSANSLVTFNPQAGGKDSIFPLVDVGNPAALIQFLIPHLKEIITTSSGVDKMLDFNAEGQMTATESMQRYVIRGKALLTVSMQQKAELLDPIIVRCAGILLRNDVLGINRRKYQAEFEAVQKIRPDMIIPDAVLDVIESGKPYFDIVYNNELENLTKTETIESILKAIQACQAIAGMYPQIIGSVEWYKLYSLFIQTLSLGKDIMIDEDTFKAGIEQQAQMQQQAMMMQAGQAGSQAMKNVSEADKNNREAR